VDINQLSAKFSQGINWNAFSYVLYKVLVTTLTFTLYNVLSTTDFASWANINSIIFLLILWLDFGRRKALPRYYPEFSRTAAGHRFFTRSIIIFQALILIVATPLIGLISYTYGSTLYLTTNTMLYALATLLFITESMVALMRLIYHAHFKNKEFNTLSSLILIAEITTDFTLIAYAPRHLLLPALLSVKVLSGAIITAVAWLSLHRLHSTASYPEGNAPGNLTTLKTAFIKHSAIMWLNTTLTSLSERNFMVPLLTHTFGPATANLFKLANDGALLFYRTILKTIGTTDTSLLAHSTNNSSQFVQAFRHLINTVVTISLLLAGIVFLICASNHALTINSYAFQAFGIITTSYLIEAVLSPFERVLEVQGHYWLLWAAYIPYVCALAVVFTYKALPELGLLRCLLIIHASRSAASCLMMYFASRQYKLQFPVKTSMRLALVGAPIYAIAYFCLNYTDAGQQMIEAVKSVGRLFLLK
jgi:hypothetical protein